MSCLDIDAFEVWMGKSGGGGDVVIWFVVDCAVEDELGICALGCSDIFEPSEDDDDVCWLNLNNFLFK